MKSGRCKKIFMSALILTLVSCTPNKKPLPSKEKFSSDTQMMLKITKKFLNESDATKLQKAAVAVQQSRVVSCIDVSGECALYGKIISHVIKISSDGEISPQEKKSLVEMQQDLVGKIQQAKIN